MPRSGAPVPSGIRHAGVLLLLFALAVVWTWPLARHFADRIPGHPGDNFSFLWNLWWARKSLQSPDLDFFRSTYLFFPFGVDLVNHPHTALQGYLSATAFGGLTVVQAENLYIVASVFLNAACAYALAFDLVHRHRPALVAGLAFGGSPYVAAHLLGHFDLLTAWVIPLFALLFRRALSSGRVAPALGCGACAAVAAWSAYYHVVYLGLFALTYAIAACDFVHARFTARPQSSRLFTARLVIVALIAIDAAVIVAVATTGGGVLRVGGVQISATSVHNPLLAGWVLAALWWLTRQRIRLVFTRPATKAAWPAVQTLAIAAAAFAVLCLPLVMQAVRLALSGRYVTQTYFWRSAPRGVDVLAPFLGNPFHPVYGGAVSGWYEQLGLDRIEAVGWIGIVPVVVLLAGRGRWFDREEARRWKIVAAVFAIWALGPFLTIGGFDAGLPLPQALARFVPIVENARMPGRAMVVVYLALAVLVPLRLAAMDPGTSLLGRSAAQWGLAVLLLADYAAAPLPTTTLDRPVVYEQLASIQDDGAVIEVPFGIGDGLTAGRGSQDRRLLYHATIHGHPVVGGYIGRMPPGVALAYESLPVVGNLLRLSNGEEPVEDVEPAALPFRYLVLNTAAASPELAEYVRGTLDMDLITEAGGRQLFAVQGMRPGDLQASSR